MIKRSQCSSQPFLTNISNLAATRLHVNNEGLPADDFSLATRRAMELSAKLGLENLFAQLLADGQVFLNGQHVLFMTDTGEFIFYRSGVTSRSRFTKTAMICW